MTSCPCRAQPSGSAGRCRTVRNPQEALADVGDSCCGAPCHGSARGKSCPGIRPCGGGCPFQDSAAGHLARRRTRHLHVVPRQAAPTSPRHRPAWLRPRWCLQQRNGCLGHAFAAASPAHTRCAAHTLVQPRKIETTRLRLFARVSEVVAQSFSQRLGQSSLGRTAKEASRATIHLAAGAFGQTKVARKATMQSQRCEWKIAVMLRARCIHVHTHTQHVPQSLILTLYYAGIPHRAAMPRVILVSSASPRLLPDFSWTALGLSLKTPQRHALVRGWSPVRCGVQLPPPPVSTYAGGTRNA